MATPPRGSALSILAVLFGLLALSNLSKPLEMNADHGFVFLGQRLKGTPNLLAGPLFGVYQALYAVGIWALRRWALAMGTVYAVYVTANLVLFPFRTPAPLDAPGYRAFTAVYALVALGCAWGAVVLLRRRRADLR